MTEPKRLLIVANPVSSPHWWVKAMRRQTSDLDFSGHHDADAYLLSELLLNDQAQEVRPVNYRGMEGIGIYTGEMQKLAEEMQRLKVAKEIGKSLMLLAGLPSEKIGPRKHPFEQFIRKGRTW